MSMNCPNCKSSWIGEPIPEQYKDMYSGTHWIRSIGIDGGFIGVYDGIVAIRCPDCDAEFPRDNSKWGLEMFEKYKKICSKN